MAGEGSHGLPSYMSFMFTGQKEMRLPEIPKGPQLVLSGVIKSNLEQRGWKKEVAILFVGSLPRSRHD